MKKLLVILSMFSVYSFAQTVDTIAETRMKVVPVEKVMKGDTEQFYYKIEQPIRKVMRILMKNKNDVIDDRYSYVILQNRVDKCILINIKQRPNSAYTTVLYTLECD